MSGQKRYNLIDKIKSGQIQKRPRSYFILLSALSLLGLALLFLIAIFFISFIAFSMNINGSLFLSGFGLPGLRALLISLPWALIVLALFFVIFLEMFAKKYAFSYKKPAIYSLAGIIGITLIGCYVIAKTPLHNTLLNYSQGKNIPVMGPLYEHNCLKELPNTFIGKALEMRDEINKPLRLETEKGENFIIITSTSTKFQKGQNLEEDDILMIMGERDDSMIRATHIRKIEDDEMFRQNFQFRMQKGR